MLLAPGITSGRGKAIRRGGGDLGGDPGAELALGDGQIVAGLQVQPELRWCRDGGRAGAPLSALIARRPFRIEVIRPEGTRSASARRLADMPRAASSRSRMRPGWIGIIRASSYGGPAKPSPSRGAPAARQPGRADQARKSELSGLV